MFVVGDKIVYPMHGAGIIEEIEDKKILGESRRYYILRFSFGDLTIMLPVDSCDDLGIRSIVSDEKLIQVIGTLQDKSSIMSANWNRRYRENMDKLKTGDVLLVAEVVRNLMRTDREKKLSTGEKKMLINAKQILSSEIILIKDIDIKEANNLIDKAINNLNN